MRLFLQLKHWQLFLLFLIPWAMLFASMEPAWLQLNLKTAHIVGLFAELLLLLLPTSWMASIMLGLNQVLPSNLRVNQTAFMAALVIAWMGFMLPQGFWLLKLVQSVWPTVQLLNQLPLEVVYPLSMLAIAICFYFTAKVLGRASNNDKASFWDVFNFWMQLAWCPLSVWWLQPHVQALIYFYKQEAKAA